MAKETATQRKRRLVKEKRKRQEKLQQETGASKFAGIAKRRERAREGSIQQRNVERARARELKVLERLIETAEARSSRLAKDAQRRAQARAIETPEARIARLESNRLRHCDLRAKDLRQEHEARLQLLREAYAQRLADDADLLSTINVCCDPNQMTERDHCSNSPDPVPNDMLEVNVKQEPQSFAQSADDIQFVTWQIKTEKDEEVEMSNHEYGCDAASDFQYPSEPSFNEKDSGADVRFYCCALCLTIFPHKKTLRKHVKTECFKKIFPRQEIVAKLPTGKPSVKASAGRHGDWKRTSRKGKMKYKLVPKSVQVLECPQCDKKFGTSAALRKHRLVHTSEKPHSCAVCGKSFSHVNTRNRHENTHGPNPHKCTACGRTFRSASELHEHAAWHAGAKQFKCIECDAEFTTRGRLYWHAKRHKPQVVDAEVDCGVCHKKFRNAQAVRKHNVIHTAKKHTCEFCDTVFRNARNKLMHVTARHGDMEKQFECADCGKKYVLLDYLKRHVKVHYVEKQVPCDVCGKLFIGKRERNIHASTHGERKRGFCEVCGRTFATVGYLKQHTRTVHPTDKRFECPVCGKVFATRFLMKRHSIVHTDVKEFECEVCYKRFNNRSNRNKHVRMHGQVKKVEDSNLSI